ncbi:MAG TPA: glycogen debranching protein GlgX [Kiritimatiellia bacterium]|nr:glycogen debranching protein GlgX [Kiritimatiellia bacterium]HMO98881.1 glycogen debranching protein GlgX [Kiritimatiellia bacterium]
MKRNRYSNLLPSVPMPVPYGAHVVAEGVQFTLFSRHASRVWLMLFDHPDAASPSAEYELTPQFNRIGDIWHIHVRNARPGQYYLYRMEGASPPGRKSYFNPHQWLLDPYALAIAGAPVWGDARGRGAGRMPISGPEFPKGVIVRDEFDWSGDVTLNIPLSETVIYETHLRGFTVHPSAGASAPGTYDGFKEKIPYLRDMGITAVEFLPIQEFNEMEYFQENGRRAHLKNFWGYSTLAFFAPMGRYAHRGVHGQQVTEFKDLVIALHRAGIEVILDVVFNHTAEGGDGGPTYSFRGIDNDVYYMMDKSGRHYMNYSGCGNTVNSNHPVVRSFIMNCLRYWVLHMHVDGFRFDLASILTRDKNGEILPDPPIVEMIAEDPALRDTKIIAEAWDAAGAYQVGEFPSEHWSEWNGRYRDDMRRFWKGERGMLGAFATRLAGSADLYQKDGQTPLKSINFITCHDGMTLRDLVSYEHKHNDINNEDNRDGDNHNHSMNFGHEGPSSDPGIEAVRLRQQKNFLATLFLSQGVPMMLAGDEISRTQNGNNNAYCQDNELNWIDWHLCDKNQDLLYFTRQMIHLRKRYPSLRRTRFFAKPGEEHHGQDIRWFGFGGGEPDWHHDLRLAVWISGSRHTGFSEDCPDLFVVINAEDHPAEVTVPECAGSTWEFELFTTAEPPKWRQTGRVLAVEGRAMVVLAALPKI